MYQNPKTTTGLRMGNIPTLNLRSNVADSLVVTCSPGVLVEKIIEALKLAPKKGFSEQMLDRLTRSLFSNSGIIHQNPEIEIAGAPPIFVHSLENKHLYALDTFLRSMPQEEKNSLGISGYPSVLNYVDHLQTDTNRKSLALVAVTSEGEVVAMQTIAPDINKPKVGVLHFGVSKVYNAFGLREGIIEHAVSKAAPKKFKSLKALVRLDHPFAISALEAYDFKPSATTETHRVYARKL